MYAQHGPDAIVGPVVIAVRGPSRSGKTAMVERLVAALRTGPWAIGYVKRTHHLLDLPHKASGRVWASGPSAMLLRASDRIQVTLPTVPADAGALIRLLPVSVDLVFLETHEPEPFPTVASDCASPVDGEQLIGRWALGSIDRDAAASAEGIRELLPADLELARALRKVTAGGNVHWCDDAVLGARIAVEGMRALGRRPGDGCQRDLRVNVETTRCAVDAVQPLTGCSYGRGTFTVSDYGKTAATFIEDRLGRAIRVSARPGLRQRVCRPGAPFSERAAYLDMPVEEVLRIHETAYAGRSPRERPAYTRFDCLVCGEGVTWEGEAAGRRVCEPCGQQAGTSAIGPTSGELEKVLV